MSSSYIHQTSVEPVGRLHEEHDTKPSVELAQMRIFIPRLREKLLDINGGITTLRADGDLVLLFLAHGESPRRRVSTEGTNVARLQYCLFLWLFMLHSMTRQVIYPGSTTWCEASIQNKLSFGYNTAAVVWSCKPYGMLGSLGPPTPTPRTTRVAGINLPNHWSIIRLNRFLSSLDSVLQRFRVRNSAMPDPMCGEGGVRRRRCINRRLVSCCV